MIICLHSYMFSRIYSIYIGSSILEQYDNEVKLDSFLL